MSTILILCGIFNIAFALFHLFFWKKLSWDSELKKLRATKKAVMQIMNIQLIYYFIFSAVICFTLPKQLLSTQLGQYFLAGTSLFWLIRTIQQLVFFKTKNRIMNMLTMTFIIGTVLLALAVIR